MSRQGPGITQSNTHPALDATVSVGSSLCSVSLESKRSGNGMFVQLADVTRPEQQTGQKLEQASPMAE